MFFIFLDVTSQAFVVFYDKKYRRHFPYRKISTSVTTMKLPKCSIKQRNSGSLSKQNLFSDDNIKKM